ncbi:MAG: hypothetical protein OJF59_002371 [Cytophagales bacterium]|jgi:3-deoxy-D-manno-octulosonate 8-phosphate phosphatase (KDO 8-P phosphatase)|nr:phosphatase [Bacteroidota bacterium]MBS1980110.1 phosphatase [Bacteroidota bacterium]WHZ08617.1 MAG: hypothetical protein OJF59_002371 [Cytophagales bacterium]
MDNTEILFTKTGGIFCRPFAEFREQVLRTRAYLFDWDGVFNDGVKSGAGGSLFSEVDAMGTNMLRFGHWLKHQHLPVVAVITGEENPAAQYLAQREKFNAIYFKSANKQVAFNHFLEAFSLKENEIAFVYDDVLDLALAGRCGLRIMVRHAATPTLQQYAIKNELADYITSGHDHAVRESCELMLASMEKYDEAISRRSAFDTVYQSYLNERQSKQAKTFTLKDGMMVGA